MLSIWQQRDAIAQGKLARVTELERMLEAAKAEAADACAMAEAEYTAWVEENSTR